ncbi:MAG: phosphoribosylformylglycinamidine cyclo-ligase [Kiritimatiellae bacterium]|jgi:phosphoribosylformylglycinamidine cyclo-ligase|nr:phosphoribosylformylglycinamidine cyclo-ligase [Kiritimatiellia bacterium]
MKEKKSAYAAAGVDIDEMMSSLTSVKEMVKQTNTDGVLSSIGSFGGLFKSPGADSILVSSADGVGTKLKVASMAGIHDTVGQDLINHCVNDILVQGAKPLFFMDYLGTAKLKGEVFKDVVKGLCTACIENGCTLLGGETAEMPGLYPEGEYDLVGTIVGVVDKDKIVTGENIEEGDVLIGLPSSGLHTNGYSLARKVIFEDAGLGVNDVLPGTDRTVADILLAVHKSYLKPAMAVMEEITVAGMAHITGGGFCDNIPRILPDGVGIEVDKSTWKVPEIYNFIRIEGNVDCEEMYRVFNMGIGFVMIVSEDDVIKALEILTEAGERPTVIGKVVEGEKVVTLV